MPTRILTTLWMWMLWMLWMLMSTLKETKQCLHCRLHPMERATTVINLWLNQKQRRQLHPHTLQSEDIGASQAAASKRNSILHQTKDQCPKDPDPYQQQACNPENLGLRQRQDRPRLRCRPSDTRQEKTKKTQKKGEKGPRTWQVSKARV